MKEVDWSKAPDGATHYSEDCYHPWLKDSPISYFVEDKKVWVEYNSCTSNHKEHFNDAVKRPPEWDGSGVPPVGTVCEYQLNGGAWFMCKITYVPSGSDDWFVAWCNHLGVDQILTFSSDYYTLQLRKIKTPEQLAAEERLHAIDEMVRVGDWCSTAYKELMGALYDAGYRKTEVKK